MLGKVKVAPAPQQGEVRVELQWIVTDSSGRERGRVVQLNDVPLKTIDPSWGGVAPTITEQAASGLQELIQKAREAP